MRRVSAIAGSVALCVLVGWPLASVVRASRLRSDGRAFPIIEEDLLAVIETKLKTLEANGGIARLQEQMREQAVRSVRRPKPVDGLSAAISRREWLHDPSAVTDDDVVDQKGNVVIAAGTRVNPLDYVQLRQQLVFVNGDRKAEVDWAVGNYTAAGAKIIFVAGSPFELDEAVPAQILF